MDFCFLNTLLLILSAFALPEFGIGETDVRSFGFLSPCHSEFETCVQPRQISLQRRTTEETQQEKTQPVEIKEEKEEAKQAEPQEEKATDETKAAPQPDPPTIEEKELVQSLLKKMDAPIYKVRKSAERELIKLGSRLPLILAELGPPTSIEAESGYRPGNSPLG